MLCFPTAKINLGLYVTEKRNDGFHSIETVFYPIAWKDALEVIEDKHSNSKTCTLHCSGITIAGNQHDNLIYKAYTNLSALKKLPAIHVYLHKAIPMGAGLGGGSADAAFFIKLMNEKFKLNLSDEILLKEAAKLGSDCTFFIKNEVTYAFEKGDKFLPIQLNLSNYSIFTIYPNLHSNTKLAYSRVVPKKATTNLIDFLTHTNPDKWKGQLENDFEPSLFEHFPEIKKLKEKLYTHGALYASMSGSGSAVFGVFKKNEVPAIELFGDYLYNIT